MTLTSFDDAYQWLVDGCTNKDGNKTPSVILGNGFSMAYSKDTFSYGALREKAEVSGDISTRGQEMFDALDTQDFELVIKALEDAARTLAVFDPAATDMVAQFWAEASRLKEALARSLAALHPDRPHGIGNDAYLRVYKFLAKFAKIYTLNYDMLLYWTLMHGRELADLTIKLKTDDGFREHLSNESFVVWDNLHSSVNQNIFYIHGALHLFWGDGLLKKLTWVRTETPLLDQIRAELNDGRFPLYVAEGSSADKATRIGESHYLAKGLSSIALSSRGLLVYGLSFSANDEHVCRAIVESRAPCLAVSVYGNENDEGNVALRTAAMGLVTRRDAYRQRDLRIPKLAVDFFDADSVRLWT